MDDKIKPPPDRAAPERIAKALARAGVGSRRDVERLIAAGRVSVKGQVLTTPAVLVDSLEGVTVDGRPVQAPEPTRAWRYAKPRGLVTTHKDPQGRPTVFEALPKALPRLVSVGRLDLDTEGLLILTNDGGLARWMELPQTGLRRRYRVRVFGTPDAAALAALAQGVTIDGIAYEPIEAHVEKQLTSNAWLSVSIAEGKNREVRRVLQHLGLRVNRLIREAYGPFSLGPLKPGEIAAIPTDKLMSALPGYFAQAGGAVTGAAKPSASRKGWAKAKPRAKTRPNARKPVARKTLSLKGGTPKGRR